MKNVLITFDILDEGEDLPVNLKSLGVHLVLDVKMDLTHKTRLVAHGRRIEDPVRTTYAGVASRETVRIALTYAALNGLDILAAEILLSLIYIDEMVSKTKRTVCTWYRPLPIVNSITDVH